MIPTRVPSVHESSLRRFIVQRADERRGKSLALVAFAFAFAVGGCDGGPNHRKGHMKGHERCDPYSSCEACTPVRGCGWCTMSDGQGVCAVGPGDCPAKEFSWTSELSSCPPGAASGDAGDDTSSAADTADESSAEDANVEDAVTQEVGMDAGVADAGEDAE